VLVQILADWDTWRRGQVSRKGPLFRSVGLLAVASQLPLDSRLEHCFGNNTQKSIDDHYYLSGARNCDWPPLNDVVVYLKLWLAS